MTIAIIVAAGEGRRFKQKKQYVEYEGVPLWKWSALPFEGLRYVDSILIVVPSSDVQRIQNQVQSYSPRKVTNIIEGGARRQDSVQLALNWIEDHDPSCSYVFIHDGVRPFLTLDLINRLWEKREKKAVIPVMPIRETVKRVNDDCVDETLDRDQLYAVQTPQLFSCELLSRAYENLYNRSQTVTDDAGAVELIGEKVETVLGEERNIKVTVPEDLSTRVVDHPWRSTTRVGQGMDIHAFTEGDKIILGGIQIPYRRSLKGHSDADVLTHAICDALLGALGLGDIGTQFPDTDPAYKGISSLVLLEKVVDKVYQSRYKIENIDSTIVAEEPKMMPYILEMKQCLAKVCKIDTDQIGIKAKTAEGLGYIGSKEGIMAMAIVNLRSKEL